MRQLSLALLMGVVIGAVVYVWAHRRAPDDTPRTPTSRVVAPAEVPVAAQQHPVFVSPAQPGLLIDVLDETRPATDARVELLRDQFDPVRSKRSWVPVGTEKTGAEGRAQFSVATGHYLAVATAPQGRAQLEFDVGRSKAPTVVTLALTASRAVAGVVSREGSSDPVPNATVRIDLGERPSITVATVTTDAFGKFAASVPNAAHYHLRASAKGYVEGAETFPPTTQASLKLERGAVLEGRVVGADGTPVENATVRVAPEPAATVTDAQGRFSLTVLAGAHSLHALATDGRQAMTRVTIALGAEVQQVELKLGGGGETLKGRVLLGEKPVASADVRVLAEPDDLEVASFMTGADGAFEARGLPRGRYLVRAQRGAGSRGTAVGIDLPHPAVEVRLNGAATLTGVVADESGNPVEGATVRVKWNLGMNEIARTARSDEQGVFEFEDLLPAEISAQATLDQFISEEQSLYVAPDTTGKLTLTITSRGRVVGTVEDPAVSMVSLRSAKTTERAKVVNGRFDLELAPGEYRVFALVNDMMIDSTTVTVKPGAVAAVNVARIDGENDAKHMMYPSLGDGLSFENANGAVKVDFLMGDCPAAKAGVKQGDLVMSVDGQPVRDATEAFAKVKVPAGGSFVLAVRRDGADLTLTVR